MVPILGNKDLRLLQTLIAEEKSVLQSSTRVSADIHRSASALSAWGASEGADLEDVCSKAADMLSLVANGFEKFSERQVDIRSLWKEIRGMEETLDDTKKRRKAVGSRSEREEKKLVKMSSEVRVGVFTMNLEGRGLTFPGFDRTRTSRLRRSFFNR